MATVVVAAPSSAGAATTSVAGFLAQATPRTTPSTSAAPDTGADLFAPAPETSVDAEELSPGGRGDWMRQNGLLSPGCLKGSTEASCVASGTRTIPAPPGHYDLDVHIDKGVAPKWASVVQGLTSTLWSGLVQGAALLFALLEWVFDFDLATRLAGEIAQPLQRIWVRWAMPLSTLAIVVGAIRIGTIAIGRRDVGRASREVTRAVMLFAAVMLLATQPRAVITTLTKPAAELGKAAVGVMLYDSQGGTQANAGVTSGLRGMWTAVVAQPYALMQFGDVDWGTNPARLDRGLKKAAETIAEDAHRGKRDLQQNVARARTNADIFLAWPANGNDRNSISDDKCGGNMCLLRYLCQADDDAECTGPNAERAFIRTEAGTTSRLAMVVAITVASIPLLGILALIGIGVIRSGIEVVVRTCQAVVLGFVALSGWESGLRMLEQTLKAFFVASLALAVWGALLGAVLTVFSILQTISVGWLIQWIITAVGMVGIYIKRHELGGVFSGVVRAAVDPSALAGSLRRGARGLEGRARQRLGQSEQGQGTIAGRRRAPAPDFPDTPKGPGSTAGGRPGSGGALGSLAARAASDAVRTKAAVAVAGAVAGPAGAAAAATAAAGWKARAARNARRMGAIAQGQIPKHLSPAEQAAAMLSGQARQAEISARSGRRQLPGLRSRRDELDAERSRLNDDLRTMTQRDPRRRELEARRAELDDDLRGVTGRIRSSESAVEAAERVSAQRGADGEWKPQAREKAERWLDEQAAEPPTRRNYAALAQMRHLTRDDYAALSEDERSSLHQDIDTQLSRRRARTSSQISPPTTPAAAPRRPAPSSHEIQTSLVGWARSAWRRTPGDDW